MLSLLWPSQSLAERLPEQAERSRHLSFTSGELSGDCPGAVAPPLLYAFQHPSSPPACLSPRPDCEPKGDRGCASALQNPLQCLPAPYLVGALELPLPPATFVDSASPLFLNPFNPLHPGLVHPRSGELDHPAGDWQPGEGRPKEAKPSLSKVAESLHHPPDSRGNGSTCPEESREWA